LKEHHCKTKQSHHKTAQSSNLAISKILLMHTLTKNKPSKNTLEEGEGGAWEQIDESNRKTIHQHMMRITATATAEPTECHIQSI
jgi:hypothetical protein